MAKELPSQERLNRLFLYDPDTGRIYRKALDASDFAHVGFDPQAAANNYNSNQAGREAFTSSDQRGYLHGKIFGVNFQAHRVIWKLVHGFDPDTIDHINNNTSDNRITNLRSCSISENSRNYRKPLGATSKYRGVCWVKRDQTWAARISDGRGGKLSLGNYSKEIDAARAYDAAAKTLHGEFAVLNFAAGDNDVL